MTQNIHLQSLYEEPGVMAITAINILKLISSQSIGLVKEIPPVWEKQKPLSGTRMTSEVIHWDHKYEYPVAEPTL